MKKSISGETGLVTVGSRGSKHRSRRERAQLLSEYRASGWTQERFAQRTGIKVGTLRAWIYKMRSSAPSANRDEIGAIDEGGGFAPVRIVDAVHPVKSRGSVTVRWPQGMEVEIAVELDGVGIERLVRKLVKPCLP